MSADDPNQPDMVVMYLHHGSSKERFTEPLTYEAALERANRLRADGHEVPALITIEHASQRKAVQRLGVDVDEACDLIGNELKRKIGPEVGRIRGLLVDAMTSGDSKPVRDEAQNWSGYVAANLLEIANRIDEIGATEGDEDS